jgi:molecular chaperone HtpG
MTTGKINVSVENIFPLIKRNFYTVITKFLRELISNGTDATLKIKTSNQYWRSQSRIWQPNYRGKIDKEGKKLHHRSRFGMTADEVENTSTKWLFWS